MIRFRTLGALNLARDDGAEFRAALAQPKRIALLAYLTLARPRGFHRRDRLLAMFWPDSDVERARAALSRAIYFLRRELGDGIIISRGDEVSIDTDRIWCDAAAFEHHLDAGEQREAVEMYQGDLLPGFFTADANGFEEWLESERARLNDMAATAAWGLASAEEVKGNVALAVHWARRATALSPFNESGIRRLLLLLEALGDRVGAVHTFEQFAARLSDELELAPSEDTRQLIADIRARDRTAAVRDGVTTQPDRGTVTVNAPVSPARVPRRRWAVPAVAAAIIVAMPAILLARGKWTRFDDHRVLVTRFENLTGDSAFNTLGRMAADRIIQGLTNTGVLDVVAPDDSLLLGASTDAQPVIASAEGVRQRARIVVTGEVHSESGKPTVQTRITDAERKRVVWVVRATSDEASVPAELEELTERTTGAVAALTTPRFSAWFPVASEPPRFAAFQEFAQAVDLQLRGGHRDAVTHLRRAIAIDSTFTVAKLQLAIACRYTFQEGVVDSIAGALNGVREYLMPLQRHWLDWQLAQGTEDPVAGYRALKAAADLAPERFLFNVADAAYNLNRPGEAAKILEQLGPDAPYNTETEYWSLLTRSYHALGERRLELAAARAARARYPDRIDVLSFELTALASQGRVQDVRALLDTALTFPRPKLAMPATVVDMYGLGLWPGRLMVAAAVEFRAHGHDGAADEALGRAIAWYRAQPVPEGAGEEAFRFEFARALYLARDWPAAEALFRTLTEADPGNVVYGGFLGAIAARRGNAMLARNVLARFDTLRPTLPRPHAIAGYWQSKISAVLGDEAGAMRALTESFGPQGRSGAHSDFDFEHIRDSRPFREFVRPKG